MTPQARRAAVRMAAKAAFVVGAVGCSGGAKPAELSNSAHAAPEACGSYLDGLAVYKMNEIPEGDPLEGKSGVYGAFKDVAARSAPRTVACCNEDLTAHGAGSKHRWECCTTLDGKLPAGADMSACTPWGPPCPPEMLT